MVNKIFFCKIYFAICGTGVPLEWYQDSTIIMNNVKIYYYTNGRIGHIAHTAGSPTWNQA